MRRAQPGRTLVVQHPAAPGPEATTGEDRFQADRRGVLAAGDRPAGGAGRGGGLRLRRGQRPLPPLAVQPRALGVRLVDARGIAARTERIELATGVTCPFIRYHPAIIAQAAATTALLSDGRSPSASGPGERLNEHVVGQGWPSVDVRHEMLREALEIIRLLWSGGYHSYEGKHLPLEDARVFDLPETLPPIVVAIGGDRAPGSPPSSATGSSPPSPRPSWSRPTPTPAAPGRATPRCRSPTRAPSEEAAGVGAPAVPLRPHRLEGAGRAAEPDQLRGRDGVRRRRRRARDVRLRAGRGAPPRGRAAVRRRRLRPPGADQRGAGRGRVPRLLRRRAGRAAPVPGHTGWQTRSSD